MVLDLLANLTLHRVWDGNSEILNDSTRTHYDIDIEAILHNFKWSLSRGLNEVNVEESDAH